MAIKPKIEALISKSNAKTEKQDATLSEAVSRLIDGYGSGGGGYYVDLSTLNLPNHSNARLAFNQGVYSKSNTVDFVIPAEAFDFGDGKWCVQLRFRKNQEYGEFATLTGVKGEPTQNQVLTEFKQNGEINAYLKFPSSTGTTPVDQVFSSESNQLGVFYTLKIEYNGTGAYTTTLFDEEWNTLKETVYESDEKVMYFSLPEYLGDLYTSAINGIFAFNGDFDMANSYIRHGDKIVWGFDERTAVAIKGLQLYQTSQKVLSFEKLVDPVTITDDELYSIQILAEVEA